MPNGFMKVFGSTVQPAPIAAGLIDKNVIGRMR
jgi:hypothetical protein